MNQYHSPNEDSNESCVQLRTTVAGIRRVGVLVIGTLATTLFAEGNLTGRISDTTGNVAFESARIQISDLNIERFSNKRGQFEFKDLPAGDYTATVEYVGSESKSFSFTIRDDETSRVDIQIGAKVDLIDNIIVYGQAAGASSAINSQRAADGVISVVDADAIGQFPDANVSEALQRIPGVYIERDQGEGRFVGIRGIEPDLNSAKINGVNIASPERDRRSVALDVIPSDLLERLEVSKTITPDKDGDAIGGVIDIKSLSAFDRENRSFKFLTKSEYNTLEQEFSPKLSGSFTDVVPTPYGELGIAISASWQERSFGSDNVETDGGWDHDIEDSGFDGAEEIEQRNYQITRKRTGIAANLDFQNDAGNLYFLRTLFSDFSDQEYRQRSELKLSDGDLVLIGDLHATWADIEMDRELKDRLETQQILSLVVGSESQLNAWDVDYQIGYSKANEEEPDRRDVQFSEDSKIAMAGYRSIGPVPQLFYSDDGEDPTNFEFDELVVESNFTKDQETLLKLDLKRDVLVAGFDGYVKLGIQHRDRRKEDDMNVIVYDGGFADDPTLADFVGPDVDYGLGRLGIGINVPALNQYIDRHMRDFDIDSDETQLSSARDYVINEDVTALYAMNRINAGNLRVIYGIRYESTMTDLDGFQPIDDNGDIRISAVSYSESYSHLLPSVTLRLKASERTIWRAALSNTIARPSFGFINPSPEKIEIDDEDLEIEAGNINLEPFESLNLDLAYEYYAGESLGMFSTGFFLKQIDNFIFPADVSGSVDVTQWTGTVDLSAVEDTEVLQPLNGNTANLWGVEATWTGRLSNEGGPLSGVILTLNGTYTTSEADLGLGVGASRSSKTALPRQADIVGNVVVGYERGPISLRLAYAYKGERLLEVNLEDERSDLYQKPRSQIDLTAKYDIRDDLQLFFNAVNITDEPYYAFHGSSAFNGQYEEYGPSYALGLSWRNL